MNPKNDPRLFLNQAEKMIRDVATEKGWTVWRGWYAGFFIPSDTEFYCIVVGLGDQTEPPDKGLFALAVTLDLEDDGGAARIDGENFSHMIPFGGGHVPLHSLEEVIAKLPSLV